MDDIMMDVLAAVKFFKEHKKVKGIFVAAETEKGFFCLGTNLSEKAKTALVLEVMKDPKEQSDKCLKCDQLDCTHRNNKEEEF